MKYCPSCNFTFPDFHHVCDFDGTELISDPEPPAPEPSRQRYRLLRYLKSPLFLAIVGLLAVVSSAVLIAYLGVVKKTAPLLGTQPLPRISEPTAVDSRSPQWTEVSNAPTHDHLRRLRKPARRSSQFPDSQRQVGVARSPQLRQRQNGNTARSERVGRPDSESNSREKEPKLNALLKTTWRVLKKPFRF